MTDIGFKRRLVNGNLAIAAFLFNDFDPKTSYVPVGYTRATKKGDGTMMGPVKLYRRLDDLVDDALPNYHNSFELLMPVIFKIAKGYKKMKPYSDEEVICSRIRDAIFLDAYDPFVAWTSVVEYLDLINKDKKPF